MAEDLRARSIRHGDWSAPQDRGVGRDSGLLAAASLISGVLAYIFVTIGSHRFGHSYAPVTVVWGIWAVTAAVITAPLQHALIHHAGSGEADGVADDHAEIGRTDVVVPNPRVLLPTLGAIVVATGVSTVVWRRELFVESSSLVHPVSATAVVAGSVLLGLWRGSVGARGRFRMLAWSLIAEGAIRVVVGVLCILFDAPAASQSLALLAGLLWMGSAPWALRAWRTRDRPKVGLGYLGSILAGSVVILVALSSPSVTASLFGASPGRQLGIFAMVSLVRVPLLMASNAAFRLTAFATRELSHGESGGVGRLVRRTMWVWGPATVVGGIGAWSLGPTVVRVAFGADAAIPRATAAVLAVASISGVVGLVLSVLAAAGGRTRELAVWAGLSLAFAPVAALLMSGSEASLRSAVTSAAVAVVMAGGSGWTCRRLTPQGATTAIVDPVGAPAQVSTD